MMVQPRETERVYPFGSTKGLWYYPDKTRKCNEKYTILAQIARLIPEDPSTKKY